jgi:hypothetical protein
VSSQKNRLETGGKKLLDAINRIYRISIGVGTIITKKIIQQGWTRLDPPLADKHLLRYASTKAIYRIKKHGSH